MSARESRSADNTAYLSGSGAGHMTIREEALTARFFGGRLESMDVAGVAVIGAQRIQGYAQAPRSVTYLETKWSTWFELDGNRGLREEATLNAVSRTVVVRSESIVLDGVPAVVIRLQSEIPPVDGSPESSSPRFRRLSPWRFLLNRSKEEPPEQIVQQTRPHLAHRFTGTRADAVVHVLDSTVAHETAGIRVDTDPTGLSTTTYHPLWAIEDSPLSAIDDGRISTSLVIHSPQLAPTPSQWKKLRRWLREADQRESFFS